MDTYQPHFSNAAMAINLGEHIHPRQQVVYTGSPAYIKCNSTDLPKWTKNNEPVSSLIVYNYTIVIMKAVMEDSGVYVCHGTHQDLNHMTTTFRLSSKLLIAGTYYNLINIYNCRVLNFVMYFLTFAFFILQPPIVKCMLSLLDDSIPPVF